MDTLTIEIMSDERADAEFLATVKAIQAGKKVTPKIGSYFKDLEAVRAILTDKRLQLLRLIRDYQPKSISELAKIAGRDFKNVYTDVMLLKRCDILKEERQPGSRRALLKFPYQSINVRAAI